jgi:hypothetical protein
MEIQFNKEVCEYLRLPSIPLKEWDGKSAFRDGVCVVDNISGVLSYAVCTFDPECDREPRVKKVFSSEPFSHMEKIFVVPSYMDVDVTDADLDEQSMKAAEALASEAEELTHDECDTPKPPTNPFCFDEIHDLEEARAWLANYYKMNRVKGKMPKTEENIKLKLLSIWYERNGKSSK